MKRINLFILITSIIFNNSVSAVTLEEAMIGAYNNSDQFQNIQNDFLTEIEQFSQALSNFMPQISANLSKQNQKQKNRINNTTQKQDNLSKELRIFQPIFNGGSGVAALKSAQSSFRASRGKYYSSEQGILLNVIKTYLTCYDAKEKYEIAQTTLESTKKQLEAAEERLNVGEATETDRANALAGVATAEANKLMAYANIQRANASFFALTGLEAKDITLPELPENLPQKFDEIINKARIKSFDLETARHQTLASKAAENISKGALLPQVNFNLKAGNSALSNPDSDARAQKINSITSAISIDIPIYAQGGAEYSKIRSAKKQTRKAAIAFDQQIKVLQANCITSWENFQAQKSGIKATAVAVTAAEVAYDGTQQEEKVGSKTILDVLNALEKLNDAKRKKIESLVGYIVSAYELKQLMGELTAKSLKLKVNYFNPEAEFKKSKIGIIGF